MSQSTSAGSPTFSANTPGYASVDGGRTSLGQFNNSGGGDGGDWASSLANDAFDAFSASGVTNAVSTGDVSVLDALGWDLASTPIPAPTPTPTPAPTPTPTPVPNTGLVLSVSEDAYLGDALYTIRVDGRQVGATRTATALHSLGQSQEIALGSIITGQHQIVVTFLNDRYDGTPETDRNLYVDRATYNGQAVPDSTLALMSSGTQSFSV